MMNEYYRVLGLIFSKPGILVIFVLGPIIYPLIMGSVYLAGRTQNVPACVVDMDSSALSRRYIDMLDQSQDLHIVKKVTSMPDIQRAFEKHEVYFGIVVPRGFERSVKKGKPTTIAVYGDGINLIPAIIGYKGIRTVTATFNAGVKIGVMTKKGVPAEAAYAAALPLSSDVNGLYNPSNNYNSFILPALLCIIFMQITFIGISAVTYEKRSHSLDKVAGSYEGSYWLYGSFLAYLTLMIPMTVMSALFSYALFDFTVNGSLLPVFCVTVLFEAVIVLLGIFLTNTFEDTMGIMICLMYVSVPIFLVSGGSWPLEAMTPFVRGLCLASPLTLYVNITRRLVTVGADPWYVREYVFGLMLWLLGALGLARYSVHNFQKHLPAYKARKARMKSGS
ncbi:MAG: ABC transporter permease [Abditibacteriota bacterium]|nr:ABC transporter permease [Abditibacteriota bacterium]